MHSLIILGMGMNAASLLAKLSDAPGLQENACIDSVTTGNCPLEIGLQLVVGASAIAEELVWIIRERERIKMREVRLAIQPYGRKNKLHSR
jgi:hypothetical protein